MVVFALSSLHASWGGKAQFFSHSWCQVLGTGGKGGIWGMTSLVQVGTVTLKDQGRTELLLQHFPALLVGTPGTNPQGSSSLEAPFWLGFPKRGWVF